MSGGATLRYTRFVALFLALQGASTLAALTWSSIDRAAPFLLDTTQMVRPHSLLHLATAALAVVALVTDRTRLFAAGFGGFYVALALAGWVSGRSLLLGLAPFDHPFHLVLGGLGLFALLAERRHGTTEVLDVTAL